MQIWRYECIHLVSGLGSVDESLKMNKMWETRVCLIVNIFSTFYEHDVLDKAWKIGTLIQSLQISIQTSFA